MNSGQERCAVKGKGPDDIQWEDCKKELTGKLAQQCMPRNIIKTGELLYCKKRGRTTCCFIDEECGKDMTELNDMMFNKSLTFLNAPKKYVKTLVKDQGYDTCHLTKEYDAKRCERDCKMLERSQFAKDCRDQNGLFKCCIRRDKVFCHECRFCCTLS